MKKAKWLLMITCVILAIAACKKETTEVLKLETSKTVLAVGETLTVQITQPAPNTVSKWTVQPSAGSTVDQTFTTGSNTMRFTQAGTYVVNAQLRTVHPDCRPSPSWDTCFSKGQESARLSTTITVK